MHLQANPTTRTRIPICIGTRDSVLALAQAEVVHVYLAENFPELDISILALKTAGDKNQTVALHELERKALWTEELENLLLSRRVDLIVHSLKDMPTMTPSECRIGAILDREDPRDAFVVRADLSHTSLATLPVGAVVGTSSVRRMAQISRLYPHIGLKDMRGNVPRRLSKLDDPANGYDALILAAAGLHRLDMNYRITEYLSSPQLLYAVGQGAIGVEIRTGDTKIAELVKGMMHEATATACFAERELLRTLEGGCSVPIGVETEWEEDGTVLAMKARVCSVDGTQVVECEQRTKVANRAQAEEFGRSVAAQLVELGCLPILQAIEARKLAIQAEKNARRAAELAEENEVAQENA